MKNLPIVEATSATPESSPVMDIMVGQWYWVKETEDGSEDLGCVVKIGSNFIGLEGPSSTYGHWTIRIHLKDWYKQTRFEPNPRAYILGRIAYYQQQVQTLMQEAKDLTRRLGVRDGLTHEEHTSQSMGLAKISSEDPKAYETALVRAKDKTLPEIFSKIRDNTERMEKWMTAETLPLEAARNGLDGALKSISGRIFNVQLYAGLTEKIVRITKGKPAPIDAKLHLMQRRLYMDEECLLNYQHGGMTFNSLREFDKWLAKPVNRDRVLPFPKCMVAFRVRRAKKEHRDDDTYANLESLLISLGLTHDENMRTHLYIRNGTSMYRMSCDLDFGEMTFPDKGLLNLSEPMMVRYSSGVERFIPKRQWEEELNTARAEEAEKKRKAAAWTAENNKKTGKAKLAPIFNPFNSYSSTVHSLETYKLYDQSNLYYDEITKHIADQVEHYNRIALIVQGLLDRSEVLHPHGQARLWNPVEFSNLIELVFDASYTLQYGDKPDFEAYRARCNASLQAGSVVVGQQDVWERLEAARENARRNKGWRTKQPSQLTHFHPDGDPGPGYVGRVHTYQPRLKKAVFRWVRERRTTDGWFGRRTNPGFTNATLTVSADKLLNVDAYKPGDYLQFFKDPRTRAEYLKWAPLLLAAEEYHAGNWEVGKRGPRK